MVTGSVIAGLTQSTDEGSERQIKHGETTVVEEGHIPSWDWEIADLTDLTVMGPAQEDVCFRNLLPVTCYSFGREEALNASWIH